MEIGSSASSQLASSSHELLAANLAKKQQVADGEAALKLLASASVATASPAANPGGSIDIKV
ncbi:hypothetical protein [Dasania marina]|uniref:hypothetical protein n=1 Tax=Dasania marina TaxID=471499 RepID=UPI0030DA1F09|tara:strand:- start:4 stop:189 length:186 start_codon:yes stop_codon:yes gene_type:complete